MSRTDRRWIGCISVMLLGICSGCSTGSRYSTDPATTQPSYWLSQPDTALARDEDFNKLWSACEDVARDYLFKLDRQDFRSGVLTTQPMVSSQWFEPWRRDNHAIYDVEESSFASIRRTIRFEFTKTPDAGWQASPKVLVERQTIAETRITSVVLYRSVFTVPRSSSARPFGTRESDQGIYLPSRYWYPLRRDTAFERVLASDVQNRLTHH